MAKYVDDVGSRQGGTGGLHFPNIGTTSTNISNASILVDILNICLQ